MMRACLIFCALFIGAIAARAEVLVSVRHGGFRDFVSAEAAELSLERMIREQYDPLAGFEIPVEPAHFPEELQRALRPYLIKRDGTDWLTINGASYELLRAYGVLERKLALERAGEIFDRIFPVSYPTVDTEAQRAELAKSPVVNFLHPDFAQLGTVGVERLLSKFAADYAFRIFGFPGQSGNCAGWAMAALAAIQPPRNLSAAETDRYLESNFQEVTPPLELGDLIYFQMPEDFHVFVYAGTDGSGEMIGLTKNGAGTVPLLFQRYHDIFRFYRNLAPIENVRYFRLVKPL